MKQINKFKRNNLLIDLIYILCTEIIVLLLFLLQFQIWNKDFNVPYFTFGDDSWRNSIFGNIISDEKWFLSYNCQFPFGGIELIQKEAYFNQWIQIVIAKIFKNLGYVSWGFVYFTYFATALLSFISLRILNIQRISALLGAILYDFLPYHFYRIGHWNLSPYYTLPVLLSMCLLLSKYAIEKKEFSEIPKIEKKWLIFCFINSFILGMSSIYYLLFLTFCISYPLFLGIINKNKISVRFSLFSLFLLFFGLFICILYGNLLSNYAERKICINLPSTTDSLFYSSGSRSLWDIVAYQLPVFDLFLPFKSNIPLVERIAKTIHQNNLFACEDNYMVILGLPLALSFVISLFYLFRKNNKNSELLVLCSKYNLIIIFFSTTLGLSLFVGLLSTGIRSYNRFSIFIAFFVVVFLCVFIDKYFSSNRKIRFAIISIMFITGVITEISPKDGKYRGLAVYDGYSYCDEYTQIEMTYKECEEIVKFIDNSTTPPRIAFCSINDPKNTYISALSKNSFFNVPKNNQEYGKFWQKQEKLNVSERVNNLNYLGYDYIIISDYSDTYKKDEEKLEELIGKPVKTTTHMKIYNLNNSNDINIETAKERFYELYNKQ